MNLGPLYTAVIGRRLSGWYDETPLIGRIDDKEVIVIMLDTCPYTPIPI